MTYITVDVDTDEVLNELDEDDIISFLIDRGNIVFTDYTVIKGFLERKDTYALMEFVHKVYSNQIGEIRYAELV